MAEINIEIRLIGEDKAKEISVSADYSVNDLLKDLNKNPEEHVVKVNDKIVPEDVKLEEDDHVETVPVVSGG